MTEAKLKSVLEKRNKILSSFAAVYGTQIEQNGDGFHLVIYADETSLTDNVRGRIEQVLHGIPMTWIFTKPPET